MIAPVDPAVDLSDRWNPPPACVAHRHYRPTWHATVRSTDGELIAVSCSAPRVYLPRGWSFVRWSW